MRLSALEFEPGSAFNYSNNNVSLRQFIVERITATTFNRMGTSVGSWRKKLLNDLAILGASADGFSVDEGRGETCLGFELSVSLPTCCGRGC